MTDYLGAGTTGANSWIEELARGRFDASVGTGAAITAIVKQMDAAVSEGGTKLAVVLAHDVGGQSKFVEENLAAYITRIRALAKEKGVEVKFVTMSQLLEE